MKLLSFPSLPQEILDELVDNFYLDFKTLGSCSLASRQLLWRSQRHLFSDICISNLDRVQRLRSLLDTNSALMGHVLKLEIACLGSWGKKDRDLPTVLHLATSLRSFSMTSALSEQGSWAQLPQGTKDAVMHGLASPTLLNLTLDSISCLPVTFFSIDMKIKYLALRRITFPRFKPETTSAAFSNYSKMTTDTLEILLHHWFEPRFQTIIEMPNSFISRIRHLIIHNFGPTILFADPIMTSALNSLETLQIREERTQPWKHVPSTRWFQRDLTTIPRLKNLEFHFMFGFCTDAEFYQSTTAALRKIINLLNVNPTAAQIQRFSIRFIRCWTELSVRRWLTASDALAILGHCGEIDQILDAGRGRVSSSSECTVGIDLGLTPRDSRRYLYGGPDDAEWHELMNRMLDAWRGKIHAMMPLASQRRALVFNDIFETVL